MSLLDIVRYTGMAALTGFGMYELCQGYAAVMDAKYSRGWRWVMGTVTSARVVESMSMDGIDVRPSIVYEYSVDGRKFSGTRIAFGLQPNLYGGRGFVDRYLARYAEGRRVRIYYDPLLPSDAVLEPGLTPWVIVPTMFGLAMLGGTVLLWFLGGAR